MLCSLKTLDRTLFVLHLSYVFVAFLSNYTETKENCLRWLAAMRYFSSFSSLAAVHFFFHTHIEIQLYIWLYFR